jgi:hypothetical protein
MIRKTGPPKVVKFPAGKQRRLDPAITAAAKKAGPQVERGLRNFFAAWRECQIASAATR